MEHEKCQTTWGKLNLVECLLHFCLSFIHPHTWSFQIIVSFRVSRSVRNLQADKERAKKWRNAINQRWFQRMTTDGAIVQRYYKPCLTPVIHTFPKLLSATSKRACSPLQMQIKNMAGDRLWGSVWQLKCLSFSCERFGDSPHCRGASCRCSRTSWLRTPSTLASPCRFRDGWELLREANRKTALNLQKHEGKNTRKKLEMEHPGARTHTLSF